MSELKLLSLILLLLPVKIASGYFIPDVAVEALKNGGFRVYIPDDPSADVSLFEPHIRLNAKIGIGEEGEFTAKVKEKTGEYWIATFSESGIKARDTVYMRVKVVAGNLGYSKGGIGVTVTALLDSYPVLKSKCGITVTVYDGGKKTCSGNTIIEDQFNGPQIDANKWMVEHWIPTYTSPTHLFNSYQNRDDTRFIKDNKLFLKPMHLKTDLDVRGTLDLTNGCTSNARQQCYYKTLAWQLLPPVVSAKIKSKISFKYGKIDIRAKLPAGEWIFPVIQLEPRDAENREVSPKVLLAYSRGNNVLRGADQSDLGSRVLFAGPVLYPTEPTRSKKLVSKREPKPFSSEFRVYSLLWEPGKMTFKVDDDEYGTVDTSQSLLDDIDVRINSGIPGTPFDREYYLSLGVAVGGLIDFPDGFLSGDHTKPWLNVETKFISKFFDKRSQWSSTWKGDDVALQVDYVKVTAI